MVEQGASIAPVAAQSGSAERRLYGQPLMLARVVWVALVMLAVGLSVAAMPYELAALQQVCTAGVDHCIGYLTPEIVQALQYLGLPSTFYAWYAVITGWIFALVWMTVALAIFVRKSDEPMALLVTLWLILFILFFSERPTLLLTNVPGLWLPVQSVRVVTGVCLFLCCYLFPDGRFVPRWTRWLALIVGLQVAANFLLPQSPVAPGHWLPPALGLPALVALLGSLVFAQVYRYRYVATLVQRQQTKWVVFGVAMTVLSFCSFVFLPRIFMPSAFQPGLVAGYFGLASVPLFFLALLPMPLSIGMAVLRNRLWDIDIVISRTLLYGLLSSCVAGIYLLVVGGLGALFAPGASAQAHPVLSLLAAGVVAILFQPLRERLQRGVNRLIYGERDEPYRVLARLGQRLETALAPEAVLPTIAETVREALKLPYAAIALSARGDQAAPQPSASDPPPTGDPVIVASSGVPVDNPLVVPLVYQSEIVGELLLGPRAPGDTWNTADRRLLVDFARQAGVAVHAVHLTAALQHARAHLVTAREEERRRLRRDLHDGLGPALGALALSADLAHDLVPRDPVQAQALMAEMRQAAQEAVQDVRRLVYALRPPALDELGPVEALRRQAMQIDRSGPEIVIDAPPALPPLPAAVEVAVYRIAQEALMNVVHHAGARRCRISVALTGDGEQPGLSLVVTDDGRGVSPERPAGVGLQSMRERAAELGGTCRIEPAPDGGTIIRAWLPIVLD